MVVVEVVVVLAALVLPASNEKEGLLSREWVLNSSAFNGGEAGRGGEADDVIIPKVGFLLASPATVGLRGVSNEKNDVLLPPADAAGVEGVMGVVVVVSVISIDVENGLAVVVVVVDCCDNAEDANPNVAVEAANEVVGGAPSSPTRTFLDEVVIPDSAAAAAAVLVLGRFLRGT